MTHFLIKKWQNRVVTLRFSILLAFISFFFFMITLLYFVSNTYYKKIISFTSLKLLDQSSLTVMCELTKKMQLATLQSDLTAKLITEKILDVNNLDAMANYTYDLVKNMPISVIARWGDTQGNFIASQLEKDGTISSEIFNRNHSPAIHLFIQRDRQGNIIQRTTSNDVDYDPRTRAWYKKAYAQRKTVWSDIYLLQRDHTLAITAASPAIQSDGTILGVFGIDIQFDYLLKFIADQPISEHGLAFIVTNAGTLIASPKLMLPYQIKGRAFVFTTIDSASPELGASWHEYQQIKSQHFSFNIHHQTYLAVYRPLPILKYNNDNWLIGIIAPQDDFTHEVQKIHRLNLFVGLSVFALGLIVISNLITRVVRPIQYLVRETEKIKRFELNDDIRTQSKIHEVIQLSDAMRAMQKGLRSFQKYVPRTLVRSLIETQEDTRVGGVRKRLSVFFSDIANYTAISETIDPNQLMIQTCEYFEALTQIIIDARGTIDKYIGDSIMAIWGAPLPEDNLAYQVAWTALQCQRKIDELNALWISQEKCPFLTRIGIHLGDAIVGNVGSSERLNYTAIGDTINIANRLEKLNKLYGTRIIVSDSVYQDVKDQFVFRMLDCVAVKGKMKSGYIYELLSDDIHSIEFDIHAYREQFALGFTAYRDEYWDGAIDYFNHCKLIYPEDRIAAIFIQRCQQFKITPPTDWDGVWRLTE